MSQEQADKLMAGAMIIQPSRAWPPVLTDGETILFEGGFDADAWLTKNVLFSIGYMILCIFALPLLGVALSKIAVLIFALMVVLGMAIAFAMYRRQTWIITDYALYIKGRGPVILSSLKRIQGFGSTVRLTGRFGLSQSLVGVKNAAEIRQALTGRKK